MLRTLLRKVLGSKSPRVGQRPNDIARRYLPAVEMLEDRSLPAVNVLASFAGMNHTISAYEPPDTDMAAGPTHIVEVVNTSISFYTKTGALAFQQTLPTFFTPVGGNAAPADIYDPVVTYDDIAGRFIVAVLAQNDANTTSFLYVAVSNTSNPTAGFKEMHKINIKETAGATTWGDYPKIGWNADAVVITLNQYTFPTASAAFNHVQIVTMGAASLLDSNNGTFTIFQVDRPAGESTLAAASMHGATTGGALGGPMYFVTTPGPGNTVQVIKMTSPLSAAPGFTVTNVTVTAYIAPPQATQQGGGNVGFDDRMLNAEWRNNTLVASHIVGLGTVSAARWYQFNVTAAPTLTQQGSITPGAGIHTYFPAITIDAAGDLAMSFIQSSTTQFESMYIVARLKTDPLNTMQAPILAKAGTAAYKGFGAAPFRSGDYSGIGIDPANGSFWAANEFATTGASGNWGTWITNFAFPGQGGGGGGNPSGAADLKLYNPLRYTYNPLTRRYTGNLMLVNIGSVAASGPITLTFPNSSKSPILINASGYDSKGRAFITIKTSIAPKSSVLIPIVLSNPYNVDLSTFFIGLPIIIS